MNAKPYIIGSALTIAILGSIFAFEPQLFGSLLRITNLAIGNQSVNSFPGPNTDVATTLDILKAAVDKAVKERDAVYAEKNGVQREIETLKQQRIAEEKELANLKASTNLQKQSIQKVVEEEKIKLEQIRREVSIFEGKLPPEAEDSPGDEKPSYQWGNVYYKKDNKIIPIDSFPTKGFRKLRYNALYCNAESKECYACSQKDLLCKDSAVWEDFTCGPDHRLVENLFQDPILHPKTNSALYPVWCAKK